MRVGPYGAALFLAFAVVETPSPAAAGPPFLTDDPEPVDYDHWEVIGFSMGTMTHGDSAGILPGVEVNFGPLPNVQLHVKVPGGFNSQSVTGTQFGYGDTEVGVKYRFINPGEGDWWPQVAIYPVVIAPTGDAARGLGSGAKRWLTKFGQVDKWNFCLRAARVPRIRSDDDETSSPDA